MATQRDGDFNSITTALNQVENYCGELEEQIAQFEADIQKMLVVVKDRHLMNCSARDKIERILQRYDALEK